MCLCSGGCVHACICSVRVCEISARMPPACCLHFKVCECVWLKKSEVPSLCSTPVCSPFTPATLMALFLCFTSNTYKKWSHHYSKKKKKSSFIFQGYQMLIGESPDALMSCFLKRLKNIWGKALSSRALMCHRTGLVEDCESQQS